jgi:hypothetical protein
MMKTQKSDSSMAEHMDRVTHENEISGLISSTQIYQLLAGLINCQNIEAKRGNLKNVQKLRLRRDFA